MPDVIICCHRDDRKFANQLAMSLGSLHLRPGRALTVEVIDLQEERPLNACECVVALFSRNFNEEYPLPHHVVRALDSKSLIPLTLDRANPHSIFKSVQHLYVRSSLAGQRNNTLQFGDASPPDSLLRGDGGDFMRLLRAIRSKLCLETTPRTPRSPNLFLSYDTSDTETALSLVRVIKRQLPYLSIWWAQDEILPGEEFKEPLMEALKNASCILVIWSEQSRNSSWVRMEIAAGPPEPLFAAVDETALSSDLGGDLFEIGNNPSVWFRDEVPTNIAKLLQAIRERLRQRPEAEPVFGEVVSAVITPEPPGWYQDYFGEKDDCFIDSRFASSLPRAAAGPLGGTRWCSNEHASLIRANPTEIDLHFSFSPGYEGGPIIQRRGDMPPVMEDPEHPGEYTTDPEIQRIGARFLTPEKKSQSLRQALYRFAGNYILTDELYSDEPGKALMVAKKVLLRYGCDGHDSFPPPRDPHNLIIHNCQHFIGRFYNDICVWISNALNNPDFNRMLFPGAQFIANFIPNADDATKAIDDVYSKNEPEYLDRFFELKSILRFRRVVEYNMCKYLRLLLSLPRIECHIEENGCVKGRPVLLAQGCGDITMNEWNVAFVSGASTPSTDQTIRDGDIYGQAAPVNTVPSVGQEWQGASMTNRSEWRLLHASGEPLNDRTYTCLIKWSCPLDELRELELDVRIVYPYQIANVRFHASSPDALRSDRHVFLGEHPIGHLIEFAVYGQQLVRNGKVRPLRHVCREFSDLRHVFKLPNLNPDVDVSGFCSELEIRGFAKRPRNIFHRITRDNVWLAEASLLSGNSNQLVAALEQPIRLPLEELGAPKDWIDVVMRYEELQRTYTRTELEPQERGQWRWIIEGKNVWLEIFLLRAQYPCSMIGVKGGGSGNSPKEETHGLYETQELYFFAHGHNYDWQGCTVTESAELLREKGATDALLFDEGFDVFQLVRHQSTGQDVLDEDVRTRRGQYRCIFWATEGGYANQVENVHE